MTSTRTHPCLFRNYNYKGGEKKDTFVKDPNESGEELGFESTSQRPLRISRTCSTTTSSTSSSTISPASSTTSKDNLPADIFVDDPYEEEAREELGRAGSTSQRSSTSSSTTTSTINDPGFASRHPGSFRLLQKDALRATSAAPTLFKPVLMSSGELYCDGGMVACNPTAVAIHEARAIFPNIPIELVVSCGTGAFLEEKSAPQFGWNGIIGQFVNSATDSEMTHHILEDMLGQEGGTNKLGRTPVSSTQYYRFNPVVGAKGDFPVDEVDEEKLEELSQIASAYMREPEQARKLRALVEILNGGRGCKKLLSRLRRKR